VRQVCDLNSVNRDKVHNLVRDGVVHIEHEITSNEREVANQRTAEQLSFGDNVETPSATGGENCRYCQLSPDNIEIEFAGGLHFN
jgi:hypothetical protein